MRLTLALMLVYVALTTVLATQVDRTFFFSDAVAIAIFGLMLAGVLMTVRERSSRGRRQ